MVRGKSLHELLKIISVYLAKTPGLLEKLHQKTGAADCKTVKK